MPIQYTAEAGAGAGAGAEIRDNGGAGAKNKYFRLRNAVFTFFLYTKVY